MGKILTINDLPALSNKLVASSKRLVVAGGCFDILHSGHHAFIEASKKQGDILILFLEADARIKQLKGDKRPINTQTNRAQALSEIPFVDYVLLLPEEMVDKTYDELILLLKPAIITSTKGDPYRIHKERQAARVGASVKTVIDRIPDVSTTHLLAKKIL